MIRFFKCLIYISLLSFVFVSCQRECENTPEVRIVSIDVEDNDGEHVQISVTGKVMGIIEEIDNCEIYEKGICVSTTKPELINGEPRSSFNQHNTIQTTSSFEPGVLIQKFTLESRKKYYIWMYALSKKYAFYSSVEVFPQEHTITSNISFSNITASTVDVSVILNSDFVVDEYGLCWSESQSPTIENSHEVVGNGKINGGFQSTISNLQSNTTYYVRAYFSNGGDIAYGQEKSFTTSFVCGTSTIKDYDGNIYNTVQIGNQCWMKENMRTTHFTNGNEIFLYESYNPSVLVCRYYPGNTSDVEKYGYLYSQYAANYHYNCSLCPTGWHLPSDEEWKVMEKSIGLTTYQSNASGFRGQVAAKLCEEEEGLWPPSGIPNSPGDYSANNRNSSGFTALPAGRVMMGIQKEELEYNSNHTAFWTSSWAYGNATETQYYYMRHLTYDNAGIERGTSVAKNGYSVRCVKD